MRDRRRLSTWLPRAMTLAIVVVVGLGVAWWWALITEVTGPITQAGHHDFFAFYSAATLIRDGHASDLYNASSLTAIERTIWPQPTGYAGYMPFLNPPSAAVVLSPLASLTYDRARIVWLAVTAAIALLSALVLTAGSSARVRLLAIVVTLGTFPAYQALVEGQWSFVMLLGALAALIAARRERESLAGIALVALWLKPPLLLLVLVWLLLTHRWRIATAAVAAVITLTLITLPWTGFGANIAYVQYLGGVTAAHASGGGAAGATAWEGAFANMEGLLGLAATFAGQSHAVAVDIVALVMAVASIAYVAVATSRSWTARPLPLGVALAVLCTGLLLDPHLYAQDCVLLLIAAAMILVRLRTLGAAARLALYGISSSTAEAVVLLGTALVMDLAAFDTYSIQGYPVPPLHLLTFVLIAAVVLPTSRQAASRLA